ncbi:MAG TPA: hypothetical protein VFX05_15010 [Casimicrobiaceae bacterium]|nr:hypothetical protein [Casimicrobiaceae bacterium]
MDPDPFEQCRPALRQHHRMRRNRVARACPTPIGDPAAGAMVRTTRGEAG